MSAENPADTVTEQRAAQAITASIGPDRKWADCTPLLFARALHDAGLLADPADRDEEAIGRAVEIIARMSWEGPEQEWPLWRDATEDDRQRIREKVQPIAETLADEGLLTNPDEFVSSWAAGKERARAERAEAEVARLNDELIHVREVAELAEKDRRTYHRDAIRAEAERDAEYRKYAQEADRDVKARLIAHRNVLRRMDRAEAEVARLHSWEGLLELLDDHWPEDIFPTLPDDQSRDPGPRIVSLIRWVAELRATVERCKALADEWERALSDTLRVEIDELRAALDGGER